MIEVEGACMSAATMIMLAADNIDISDNSMFMFHNYSGGVIGKGGEMYDNIIHERQWSEQLLRDVYDNFLEEDEIQQILDNRDIWMDSDEVVKRLISRDEVKKDEESS
jgi:ATP-dependent protease ClpP protease subunit